MPFLGKTPSQIVDPEVDIDGGTIDGVSIGSVTANAGAFTNLTATGTLTLPDDGISGDDVNGGTISNFASTGIDDNATSTAITIDSSQNVGIGVTPAGLFNAGGNLIVDQSGDTVPFVKAFRATTGNNRPIFQTESNVGVTATFAGDGNVGVGTSSPTTPMHIQNSAVSPSWSAYAGTTLTLEDASNQGTILQFVSPSSYTTEVWFGDADSRNSGRIRYEHSGDKMELWSNGAERVAIDNSGNINVDRGQSLRWYDGTIGSGNINAAIEGTGDPALKLYTRQSGTSTLTERMRIDSSGDVFIKNGGELKIERPGASNFSSFYTDTGDSTIINNSWSNKKIILSRDGNVGIAGTPTSFGAGVATLQLKGLSSSQPTRAGALRFISNNGTSCDTAIYSDNGFMSFYTGTSSSQNLNLQIDTHGGLNIKSVAGTQAATFGGSNLVNGITALPSSAGTPFVVGRDTGTTRSAHFAGHLKFDSGYGIDFDVSNLANGTVGSNVLDDYEEGTFTPYFSANGGTSNVASGYSYQTGRYTKIGDVVFYGIDMSATSISQASYSYVSIQGLPFTSSNTTIIYNVAMYRDCGAFGTIGSGQIYKPWVMNNATWLYVQRDSLTTGSSLGALTFYSGSGRLTLQGFYYAA